jgi:hypothetical protein
MTPQDHNKVIGIMHLIWGGFNALIMIILVPFFLIFMGIVGSDPSAPPEMKAVFGLMGAFVLVLAVLFGIPPLLAGYAMLKRKSWAKVAGIISSCLCALSFPFGTALCVYTLWFLFGEGAHYHRAAAAAKENWRTPLRDATTFDWQAQRAADASRPREYVPPPQPPDWRGQ